MGEPVRHVTLELFTNTHNPDDKTYSVIGSDGRVYTVKLDKELTKIREGLNKPSRRQHVEI